MTRVASSITVTRPQDDSVQKSRQEKGVDARKASHPERTHNK